MRPVASFVVALPLVLTGCGGGDEAANPGAPAATDGELAGGETISYTSSLCQSLRRYQDAAAAAAEDAAAAATGSSPVSERKAAADGALVALGESLADLVVDLRAAGAPDVAGGQALATGALTAFGALPEVVEGVRAEIADLPAEDFSTAAATILAGIGSRFDFALAGLDVLSSEDLDAAAADAPECAGLF